jgi:predicted ATP-grasp superfamily ATP-dependent carboligase
MSLKGPDRVLVFGDDMRIFLAVVRSLGRAGKEVHAAPFNWHSPALKSRYISAIHHLPRYSDGPTAWREAALDLLHRHKFDLIVPCCDDRSILPFHIHRQEFSGYPVAIPNATSMELLFDKERTHQLCIELGVPISPAARLQPNDSAQDLISRFGLPLVIKPRRSYWADRLDAWGKVFIVESETDLRKILSTIQEPQRYLVEGYFEGEGVGVSVLADNGTIFQSFQHRRLREGWGGSSSYRISESLDSRLYGACEKICTHTGFTGVCMFEFRRSTVTRDWVLLETNARFWGSLPLPLSLGVDFPRQLYGLLVERRRAAQVEYPVGIRSRNVVLDGLNLFASLRRLRPGQWGSWLAELGRFLAQPAYWLGGSEKSDTFVSDDLRPAFWECATLLKSVLQKRERAQSAFLRRRDSEQAA